jgi:hypothetical protein
MDDLIRRPINNRIVERPPKSVQSQVHWFEASFDYQVAISSSADTESNYALSVSVNTNFSAALINLFDQYCIYAISASIIPSTSAITSTGSSATVQLFNLGRVTTAIDFDSSSNLGSESAVQAFGTSNTSQATIGQAIQRFYKPCVDSSLYVSSVSSGYAPARLWIDSSSSSTPHYGLRTYFSGSNVAWQADIVFTLLIGGRNNQ